MAKGSGAKRSTAKGSKSEFDAFEKVHSALLPLTAEQRGRLIAAVTTLLATSEDIPTAAASSSDVRLWAPAPARSIRPLSVVELLNDKTPETIPGKIALFAYHREKNEGKPRFARRDLVGYFARAHESPPANYDRDFIAAVKKGWIHEDGSESYITSKGITEVESGFPNERKHDTKKKAKKKPAKRRGSTAR